MCVFVRGYGFVGGGGRRLLRCVFVGVVVGFVGQVFGDLAGGGGSPVVFGGRRLVELCGNDKLEITMQK